MDIRPATAADIDGISAIYDEQVRTAVSTFDLEPRQRPHWEQRLASTDRGDHVLVAIEDEVLLGYAYSSAYRPRPGYAHTRETSVYLDPRGRGRGLGRRLYDELLARLRADDVHLALAVVALPNPASEALHRACGYEQVGLLPEVGWKFDRWIDTALYALRLAPSS